MSSALAALRLKRAPTHVPLRISSITQLQPLRPWKPVQHALRGLHTATAFSSDSDVPQRAQSKDEVKIKPKIGDLKNEEGEKKKDASADGWELTVGIEVHAQLNTERKLFSRMVERSNLYDNRS